MLAVGQKFSASNEDDLVDIIITYCARSGFSVTKDGTRNKRKTKTINGIVRTIDKTLIGRYFRCSDRNTTNGVKCKFRFSVLYEMSVDQMTAYVDIISNQHNHGLVEPVSDDSDVTISDDEEDHYNEKVLVDRQISKNYLILIF